eukprot:Sspe_Gene.119078::Locus_114034_Transcript_2_2_Confidence_0.500_Length_558::g.119078::m.119078
MPSNFKSAPAHDRVTLSNLSESDHPTVIVEDKECKRCSDPSTRYCTATGLPHHQFAEGRLRALHRWIPMNKDLDVIQNGQYAFLDTIANMFGVPRGTVRMRRVVPIFVWVTSVTHHPHCGGKYRLAVEETKDGFQPVLRNRAPYWVLQRGDDLQHLGR